MSYTFLLESGEISSAESYSDIPASVLSSQIHTAANPCCDASAMDCFHDSQFGTTPGLSTEPRGNRESILSRRASRVTISHRRAKRLALMEKSLPCSVKFAESYLRLDLDLFVWKTAGNLWDEVLPESSVSLPNWGMTHGGVVLEPVTSEPTMRGFGRGLFPTPCAGNDKWNGTFQEGGGSFNHWRETWLGVQWINPGFWEEIMGLPIGWTGSLPLEERKFQQWLQLHTAFFQQDSKHSTNTLT